MIGLTVVGKPAATRDDLVAGHEPPVAELAARSGAVSATRFADEPELTSSACRTPEERGRTRARTGRRSGRWSARSRARRRRGATSSSASKTRPAHGHAADSTPGSRSMARGPAGTAERRGTLGDAAPRIVRPRATSASELSGDSAGSAARAAPRTRRCDTRRSSRARPSSRPNSGDQPSTRRALAALEVLVADLVAAPRCGRRARGRLPIRRRISRTRSSTVTCTLVREVERLARQSRPVARQRFGERHVGGGAVLDVEVVADERAVGADHGPLAAEDRADRAGDDPVPVQVAAAVEVAAAGDRHRQAVGRRRTSARSGRRTTC